MTSNLGHGRLSLLYLILMSSWQMITELNKKHPTQPTIVAVCVFSRPVYKDLRRVWEVHRVSQKILSFPPITNTQVIYLPTIWNAILFRISCHFDVSWTSASHFFFLLISFYSFISSVTVLEQTSEVKTRCLPVVAGLTLVSSRPSSCASACPLLSSPT